MSPMIRPLMLVAALTLLSRGALAQGPPAPAAANDAHVATAADPADPAVTVPDIAYHSVWTDYQPFTVQQPASWDLRSGPPETLPGAEDAAGHDMASMRAPSGGPNPASTAKDPGKKEPATAAAGAARPSAEAAASDTRGVIQAINAAEGKVKLKHGPIPKLSMPPMTMMYRVQDPRLLEQIKVGEEVGVTVDQVGDVFVITGFQK